MKNILKEFEEILINGTDKEVISFLRLLSSNDKKELAPSIKKIARNLNSWQNALNFTPTDELSKKFLLDIKRQLVLHKFAFVCLNYEEMRRAVEHISLEEVEETILPWYQPSWLNRYLLEMVEFQVDYKKMIEFMNKGWLVPTKHFIAQNAVYGLKDELKYPISKEHIWHLFEEDTNLYCYDDWIKRFKHYAHQGEISRDKLLQESILTSIRNFNKPQTGWFLKLFNALEPTENELLSLQDELFLALGSPQSKAVGDALKYLKQISKHPDFKLNNFIEQIPVLLTWSIKSLITSTLSTIDVLVKIYPNQKEELGLLIVQALAQEDETLQTKTIKLLAKHKLLETQSILDEIAIYSEGLYHSTKQLLPDIEEHSIEEEAIEITPPQRIREENRIIYPEYFDDMVFFFSGVLMNEEPHALDIFLATLPKFDRLITNENIVKLEPIFYSAFKSCYPINFTQTFRGRTGRIFAYYLATYGLHLSTKFTNAQYIEDSYTTAREATPTSEFIMPESSPLEEIKHDTQSDEFSIIFHLMDVMLEQIKSGSAIGLLSQCTHLPCYIDEKSFNSRIKEHKKLNISTDIIDLQLAKERYTDVEATKVADTLSFEVIEKAYKKDKWKDLDANNTQYITSLRIQSNTKTKNTTGMYRYFSIKNFGLMPKVDIQRIMTLVPSNIHLVLHSVIQTALTYSTFSDQRVVNFYASETSNKELVQDTLSMLIPIWNRQHPTNYLFVATSMLYYDKTSRQLSAELWYKATLEGTLNHQLLGETLGKLEHNEYAPLKRFTDLVVSNILNLSTLHNKGLHTLLSAMISQMNDKPIKGTKKLLEIYLEVLSLTKLSVPSETMQKLEVWSEVKSLKSVVKKILQY